MKAPETLLRRIGENPGADAGFKRLVVLLTQLGDFDSMEYAQALVPALPASSRPASVRWPSPLVIRLEPIVSAHSRGFRQTCCRSSPMTSCIKRWVFQRGFRHPEAPGRRFC